MSSPVISVRGLGKKYRLGETIRHDTLRDKIAHSLKSLFARKVKCESRNANRETNPQSAIPNCPPIRTPHSALRNPELSPAPQSALHVPQLPSESPAPRSAFRVPSSADFWALKDVSFDVQQGEVVGIIGRNGAGKSTLLKILSQITEPTEGEIRMRGRVASLLEVGTGFHPELTGRENIFLNGAILGMARSEIRKKFDEIVAFAEVEKFIDTPVKRYSSGMYVRLAFAVAAHLEPEILIVDEVLAVGDAEFQKKCLGKMKNVSRNEGRTVLFVSHNMEAVKQLCENVILMNHGRINYAGEKLDAVKEYQNGLSHYSVPLVTGTKTIRLIELKIKNAENKEIHTFNTFDKVFFELRYKSRVLLSKASFALCFDDINGNRIISLWSSFQNIYFDINKEEFTCIYEIEQIHLNPGIYSLVVYAESNGTVLERIDNHMYITVGYIDKYGLVKLPEAMHGRYLENFNISMA